MRTIYLKDSSNRRKQFALTTRICIENEMKVVVKEPCFPEGIHHIRRIAESQQLFAKYYKNVEISKTWIKDDKLFAEFIDGIPLSDFYIKAIQNNDKDEIIRLFKYHLELALGKNNTCIFKSTDDFINIFGETNSFVGEAALNFTFFDPLPENIIFINGDIKKPCFIDYEWFFDFPIPISFQKFRIAQQFSLLPGIDDIIPLGERLKIIDCFLSIHEGRAYYYQFSDFVFKDKDINYSYQNQNKNFEKNILLYPEFVIQNYTLYFDTGNGYSERDKYNQTFTGNKAMISCSLPENTGSIRLDPIDGYGCVVSGLEILSYGGIVKYEPLNGFTDKNGDLFFMNSDPQIEINGASNWINIKYTILLLSEFSHYRILNNYITAYYERNGLIAERDNLITERNGLTTERDSLITKQNNLIARYPDLSTQICTFFFDTGNGYSEKEKQHYTYTGNEVEINCHVPDNTVIVRFDPVEGYGCIISNFEILSYNGIMKYEPLNGYKNENGDMVFTNIDPQIKILGVLYWLKIKYRIQFLTEFSQYRVLNSYIINCHERNALMAERDGLVNERDGLVNERNNLVAERDDLVNERNGLVNERDGLVSERAWLTSERYKLIIERDGLINSRSWRITKPLRNIGAFIRRNKILYLFAKAVKSLKRNGIIKTLKKIITYKRRTVHLYSLDELAYKSEYQKNIDFSKQEPRAKAIAFYLPQFHAIPENDNWWGKGFTEWTNTRKARPMFEGHYQPHEPHKDFGYYNLTSVEILKKQAVLAKQHGIYGFCFYLYWFSGKRLLEKPLDLFLAHPEIDINFCLCWANENWTRVWDGEDKEILIQQEYSEEDPFKFINDIKKYVIDTRYIRINGEPVVLVYNPSRIPNAKETFIAWKKHALETGIGKIQIWITRAFDYTAENLNVADVVDAELEFPPNMHHLVQNPIQHPTGKIFDYNEVVALYKQGMKSEERKLPLFRTCMLGWDNVPRRVSGWTTFAGFSLDAFFEWASLLVNEASKTPDKIFFVNAWNEWAEGTYLEPDKKYGYANINTLSKAIYLSAFNDSSSSHIDLIPQKPTKSIIFVGHDSYPHGAQLLALNIIKQMSKNFKYKVYLILLDDTGPLINDYKKITCDVICFKNFQEQKLKKWVESTNANIAVCNTVVSGDVLHILKKFGITCISLIHEMENMVYKYSSVNTLNHIIKDSFKIVFPSDYVKRSIERINSISDKKTVICPQGMYTINPYIIQRETVRYSIRKKHDIPQNSKIILGIGYGDYRKGFDLFLNCMEKVTSKYADSYFVWVGNIDEKIILEQNEIINRYKKNNKLILTGWEKDPMMYYAAADIYLLTSREDPFPSVVMEAMYTYLPVIAFEGGGGYVEIVNEKTGSLIPKENTDLMSERIIKLLNSDDIIIEIGNNAHNLIIENFNFVRYIFFLFSLLGKEYKKVSVIIPNYNYAKYLKKRIDSILTQTYPVFEIIILDDCSTDDSLSVIEEYIKIFPLQIKLIKNNVNSGNVFKQWEKGIEAAKGDYIWIAETDDLSEPTFLETLINKMSLDDEIVMGYTQSKIMNEDGKIINNDYLFYTDTIDKAWHSNYIADGKVEIEKRLSVINTILNVSSVIFKNNKLLEVINHALNYSVAGDWRFYIDLLKENGKIVFIADSLNIHRRHTNSITKTLNAQKHYNEVCELQEYIYNLTNNDEYFDKAKKSREGLKKYLGIL
jgi:glycosyltransferase involved in cell wall biosynthesis/cell division protein FtsL